MQSTQADAGVNRGPSVFAPRPKPRRESVPLERLTFSADNQMRDLPDGALHDEAAVTAYVEALVAGAVFPPLEAVEEQRKGRQPVYWVFAGFTRGEAYRRWGKANSVEVLVYPGTAADAQFYALSENRTHGQRSTHGDKQKAVYALLDTPPLLLRAKNAVETGRTLHMTIAAACGVSESVVNMALAARSLGVSGRQIVPRQKHQSNDGDTECKIALFQTPVSKTAPETFSLSESDDSRDEPRIEPTPARAEPAPVVSVSGEDPVLAGAKTTLAEISRQLRAVARNVEDVLRGPLADRVRNAARANEIPLAVTLKERKPQHINDPGIAPPVRVETWPALAALQAVFEQVGADLANAAAHDDWQKGR